MESAKIEPTWLASYTVSQHRTEAMMNVKSTHRAFLSRSQLRPAREPKRQPNKRLPLPRLQPALNPSATNRRRAQHHLPPPISPQLPPTTVSTPRPKPAATLKTRQLEKTYPHSLHPLHIPPHPHPHHSLPPSPINTQRPNNIRHPLPRPPRPRRRCPRLRRKIRKHGPDPGPAPFYDVYAPQALQLPLVRAPDERVGGDDVGVVAGVDFAAAPPVVEVVVAVAVAVVVVGVVVWGRWQHSAEARVVGPDEGGGVVEGGGGGAGGGAPEGAVEDGAGRGLAAFGGGGGWALEEAEAGELAGALWVVDE